MSAVQTLQSADHERPRSIVILTNCGVDRITAQVAIAAVRRQSEVHLGIGRMALCRDKRRQCAGPASASAARIIRIHPMLLIAAHNHGAEEAGEAGF